MSNRDQAIERALDVVDAWNSCVAAGKTIGSKAVVDIKTEELVEVLLDNFSGDIDATKLPEVFSAGTSRLDHTNLLAVPDAMVPIAVMRELLHTHKVMFNPKNVSNWKAFVQRFGRYIMGQ
ncbi:MAG: hypothetical protein EOP83_08765 [Verrucomicrobiaceae bacterium]|nr:MAG: hypothetical protein EOP83_08765 [Verrucomicrobiaceae bacterium]